MGRKDLEEGRRVWRIRAGWRAGPGMASLVAKGKSSSSNENMQQRSSACSSGPESDDDTSHHLPPVHGYSLAFDAHTRLLFCIHTLSLSLFGS